MPTTVAVIFNPTNRTTAKSTPDDRRQQIRTVLSAHRVRVLWHETSNEDPGHSLVSLSIAQGAEVILVSGGDGTVMACANALAGAEVPMAIVPSGTGNIIAASLRLPSDVAAATEVALHGDRRWIDLACSDSNRVFFAGSIGATASVMRDASPRLKARTGMLAYGLSASRHVLDRPQSFRLLIDDRPISLVEANAVLIGNFGQLITRPRLQRTALDDGLLEIGILRVRPILDWLRQDHPIFQPTRTPPLDWYQGRRVTVDCDQPLPTEQDGDWVGSATRLEVRVVPSCLRLCVPRAEGTAVPPKRLRSWVIRDTGALMMQGLPKFRREKISVTSCAWETTEVRR